MSKFDKLLQRIKNLDKNLRFQEISRILEAYGYRMNAPHGGSSHCTFRKDGDMPITIPRHDPVKPIYVLMVKAVIEREG